MKVLRSLFLALVLPALVHAAPAVTPKPAPKPAPKTPPQATANPAPKPAPKAVIGFRGEFLANLDEVQEKLLELAETTPADKFGWRPAPGVRSISEVYMHV